MCDNGYRANGAIIELAAVNSTDLLTQIVVHNLAIHPRYYNNKVYWQASRVVPSGGMREADIPLDGFAIGTTPGNAIEKLLANNTVFKLTEDGEPYQDDNALPWTNIDTVRAVISGNKIR